MQAVRFSFVMVSYNPRKDWRDLALKSAQGLFDEYITVDDGSNPPIEGVTTRHSANKGCYAARNTGSQLCSGEWIASLDDDDEFIPENVLKLKEFALRTDADIISFPIAFFGNSNGLWAVRPDMNGILNGNQIPSNSWMRKSAWEKLKGFQYPLAEDWDFWARAIKHKLKFAHFSEPIYRHRVRNDSVSAKWSGPILQEIKAEVKRRYEKEQV